MNVLSVSLVHEDLRAPSMRSEAETAAGPQQVVDSTGREYRQLVKSGMRPCLHRILTPPAACLQYLRGTPEPLPALEPVSRLSRPERRCHYDVSLALQ